MSDPTPSTTDAAKVWASLVALALSLAAVVAGLALIPMATLEWLSGKGAHLVEIIATDPQSAAATVLSLGGFVAALIAGGRALLHTTPKASPPSRPSTPTSKRLGHALVHSLAWVVFAAVCFLAGCSLLSGCGAAPLQVASMGVTVALRGVKAGSDVYAADLERRQDACGEDDACIDAARDHGLEDALDALDVGVLVVGSAIATAADVDAGQALPDVVLAELRRLLALFDRLEAALLARGIVVPPEIGWCVHAVSALLGPEVAS